jgi:hypothetical protein
VLEEISQHNKALRPVRSKGHGGGKLWELDISENYDIDKGGDF